MSCLLMQALQGPREPQGPRSRVDWIGLTPPGGPPSISRRINIGIEMEID